MTRLPFLRIPPFPGHRAGSLAEPRAKGVAGGQVVTQALLKALRHGRVGGGFWQPAAKRPEGRDVVLCAVDADSLAAVLAYARANDLLGRAILVGHPSGDPGIPHLAGETDPWTLLAGAAHLVTSADDEMALVAAVLGVPLTMLGQGRFATLAEQDGLSRVLAEELCGRWSYRDPFDGREIDALAAIAMLSRWRELIDANRKVAAIHGIARWKRITADNLLWDGSGPVRHDRMAAGGQRILAWITRSDPQALAAMRADGVQIGEIEDGMIRSTGLGANCVPPLSIVVDAQGPHFDPAQASALETLLETAEIDAATLARSEGLRAWLVDAGISKYGQDDAREKTADNREGGDRRVVLVTGQVEDDRSVLSGGFGLGNLDLLRRARAEEPKAYIIFKPHPDVEAGHRKGHVPDALAREFADSIDRTSSIAALLDRVDAVHVLTSLAGFEALMRHREVVTHGVPFYAGWGLTRDLGPVPARRTRRRTLSELVAATLILYPRYLDPVTRLPCEPEVLVGRIAAGEANVRSPLIRLREWQGRLNRLLGWRERR